MGILVGIYIDSFNFITFDKSIYMLLDVNETVSAIAKEALKLDPLEQQMLLTKLRVKRLKKKGSAIVSSSAKAIKNKPTLKQIDKWKHESRLK